MGGMSPEGIWGTGVFSAFELKSLTKRRFPFLIFFLNSSVKFGDNFCVIVEEYCL